MLPSEIVSRENGPMGDDRDHIFISYATEQSELSDWLARRLASEGYAVWYDRLKLLGGEDWPSDIDEAIERRTFRMLALLSRASMSKPNPQGEWLKGRAIGDSLGVRDFLIPLNTEGLRPDELRWNLQTTNYIPFAPSWAVGITALLKKLRSVSAPRVLENGPRLAVESLATATPVSDESESLLSNCFEFVQVPRHVRTYITTSRTLSASERQRIRKMWACRDVSPAMVLAFHDPPDAVMEMHEFRCSGQDDWRGVSAIAGIDSRDLVVDLLHRSLHRLMQETGMQYSESKGSWFIPEGLLPGNRVTFAYPHGRSSWFRGVGERKYPTRQGGEIYRYHLSPSFSLLRNHNDPYILLLRNRVYFTDANGEELEKRQIPSRRKHVSKNWFNREWCARTLGIVQLLSGGEQYIRFGHNGDQQIIVNATPITLDAPVSIRDELAEDPDETYTMWIEGDDERPVDIGEDG